MSSQDTMPGEKKHIVSMRLNNNDRNAMQAMASRLCIRESELYRLAVSIMLKHLIELNDLDRTGSDLLPLFIDFREELVQNLGLKKQQLFNIINNGNIPPDKFVGMADIELLLLPQHLLKQRLLMLNDVPADKQQDLNAWLKSYFVVKYDLEKFGIDEFDDVMKSEIRTSSPAISWDS